MESNAEPWFPDARVKTCVTVMRRCNDEAMRNNTLVKFVQFRKPLADIIGIPSGGREVERQQAVQRLRGRIEHSSTTTTDDDMRIVVKPQSDLWESGVRAGQILGSTPLLSTAGDGDDPEEDEAATDEDPEPVHLSHGAYAAGKWGRYVRAPDFYFEILGEFGPRFIPLGELVRIRRGITSGCDAFFMPHDITERSLAQFLSGREFRSEFGVERNAVSSGQLKIVKAGDGSVHCIEARFLAPEIHSPMNVDRPIVRASELDRLVLLVGEPIATLAGTYVAKYLRYGETHTFESKKSKPVPVPKRSTCKAREPWYDLTKLAIPGFALWPKSQQYRHIAPANPERVIVNCNLYDIAAPDLSETEQNALAAILNSTLVGFIKTFYGRFAGTEGNLKTEVVDVNLLEVPSPKGISEELQSKLSAAFGRMQERSVGRLVEEQLMDCHSPERAGRIAEGPVVLSTELSQPDRRALDEAVFEVLGVGEESRRAELVDRLHHETALHFRQIRVVEVQKMEQRKKSVVRKFSAKELAEDLWDAAELEDLTPLKEWVAEQQDGPTISINIPESFPAQLSGHADMFDNETVYFGKDRKNHMLCKSRDEAELVKLLADSQVHGDVAIPSSASGAARLKEKIEQRINQARVRFAELAQSRTGLEEKQDEVIDVLLDWFVRGGKVED
jgi:hypothetical protein